MAKQTGTFVLRNYPDDDALQHPEKYPKALSFCPDIVPTYGMDHDQSTLVDPASLRGFSGLPVVAGDVNNVYIRGYGSGGPYIASLWVMPSELILWPQAWQNVAPVPSGPVVIAGGKDQGPYASDGPFQFRPPHTTGNAFSLVANIVKHDANQQQGPQTFDLKTFGVDDFVHFLSKDETFSFYNVIVADPTLRQVAVNTRLRMIGNLPVIVTFRLEWHSTPVPHGLEVSLVDDRGRIAVPRVAFEFFRERTVILEPTYDGILMLNVFAPAENPHFDPYSGISLKVFKGGVLNPPLLGALNIIFESQSTRNIRFASPAASQLRAQNTTGADSAKSLAGSGSIPVTNPATGWWTRATLTDTNKFPHSPIGYSPDIQPIGTDPSKQDFLTILQNPALDYSTANNIELVGNANNYLYMRGHSTLAGIDVQGRLFALSMSTLNHPSYMLKEGLRAQVFGSQGTVNDQSISVANPNQFYMFEKPFMFDHPPGDSNNHYCLIGEVRQKRQDYPVFPGWPTDDVQNYTTLADFEVWVLSNPLMCWRNINWEPCQPGGQANWTWSCTTRLCIPDASFYSSFWTIVVECDNANIPAGSTWSLVSDDNKVFPNGTVFSKRTITDAKTPPFAGVHFTGARPGYITNLTLTVTWSGDGSKIPPPSIQWRLATTETLLSPIMHLAIDTPPGSDDWPLYVTQDYPFVGNRLNPSPLPSFKAAGLNTWPYKGAMQFHVGQVSLAAKLA